MYMKPQVTIFIFRRDLRVFDNLALHQLNKAFPSVPILPIFIFNPNQIDASKNKYFSNAAVEFMIESLHDLETHVPKLYYFEGHDEEILNQLLKHLHIEAIGWNEDYTPFARKRDGALKTWCDDHKIASITCTHDYNLMDFKAVKTDTGNTYEVFTPLYRKIIKMINSIPFPLAASNVSKYIFYNKPMQSPVQVKNISKYIITPTPKRYIKGGRKQALQILDKIKNKEFKAYENERNFPALAKTTHLSAYMKFGNLSVREVFWTTHKTYGVSHGLIREYIWRFFYSYVIYFNDKMLQHQVSKEANKPMKPKFASLQWSYNEQKFKLWCEGKTGFPIVDAAMISMNQTGFMHNRLRMIVAMFLVKDLHIDWTLGEQYFATKLVDYDPCSNSGGWQWCASVGPDASPSYRIFNPWIQSAKFDPQAIFIKKWIPPLQNVPAKHIHEWFVNHVKYQHIKYPPPILDHSIESKKSIEIFKKI